jgi:hypothetical protein
MTLVKDTVRGRAKRGKNGESRLLILNFRVEANDGIPLLTKDTREAGSLKRKQLE